jgi:2-oxoacid:acceptor oxidoreductase delta subunit (pyruvate/2-ketoisovalerate family)
MTKTPFAITLGAGSSLANKTGAWRTQRPVYVSRQPPCATACPADEDPQQWLFHAEEAGYEDAWRAIAEVNPFPAVIGRVCFHPCQGACNRAEVDEAVGINSVERFLGDEALRRGWTVPVAPPTGHRVLVVGAGPAGLTAAYQLARRGHDVTVADAALLAGGMMRYGIPSYRLPRNVLDAEIKRIEAMGVTLQLGRHVTDLDAELREGRYEAAFVAVGAQVGRHTEIPAGDSAHIVDAISLLHGVADGQPPLLGRRVIVYGGGDTAMDAARTARRIGATEAVVVYRRTRDRMPAHVDEVEQAEAEGVRMHWLSTINGVSGDRVVVEKMALDDSGFPQPTGEFEELAADAVVLALGQDADLALLASVPEVVVERGTVAVDQALMTGRPGVFAGGDIVGTDRTVTTAIGHGTRAARAIDAYLRRDESAEALARSEVARRPATLETLNTWYYSDAPASVRPQLAAARRVDTFDEVVGGLDEGTALFEARRCMSCGNCFECDNCYSVCPDNAISKLNRAARRADPRTGVRGTAFEIDYDYCKGCSLCVAECPAGAIEMIPEQS